MRTTRSVTLRVNDMATSNTDSCLVKLPREIRLRIFKSLLTLDPDALVGQYIENYNFNRPETVLMHRKDIGVHRLLGAYGCICKALRPVAVTAYYESNLLELKMIQDAAVVQQWREKKRPALTEDTWIRFGKIYFEFERHRLNSYHRHQPSERRLLETQYAIELPPRYVRPLIRRINLNLIVPSAGYHSPAESRVELRDRYRVKTTRYDDPENGWLAPIFALHTEYGFARAAQVNVYFNKWPCWGMRTWPKCEVEGLKVWVIEKLAQNAEIAGRLRNGELMLHFREGK